MTEEWRDIQGMPYRVSSLGRIESSVRSAKRILKPGVNWYGYCGTNIGSIHSLVAGAFIGERPDGYEVCHSNGIPWDNRPENLRYDTRTANRKERRRRSHGSISRELAHEISATIKAGKMTEQKALWFFDRAMERTRH